MIALITLSLLVNSLIALFISIGFYFISPKMAASAFWLTFAILWIIMEPINRLLRIKSFKEEQKKFEKLTKYEESVGKQAIGLECEYCGEQNLVKVSLNEENSFECTKCNNINKIMIQFGTIRVSNPLEMVPQVDINSLEELEEEENK